MDVRLRALQDDDLDHLGRLEHLADQRYLDTDHPEIARSPGMPREVARRHLADETALVAEVGDERVGFIVWSPCSDPFVTIVDQLSVVPEHGRRGIGTALLEAAVESIERHSSTVEWVAVSTQRSVPWNAPWYERRGFAIVAEPERTAWMAEEAEREMVIGIDWSDRVWMRRPLRNRGRSEST